MSAEQLQQNPMHFAAWHCLQVQERRDARNWSAPLPEPLERMIPGTYPEATIYQYETFKRILDSFN